MTPAAFTEALYLLGWSQRHLAIVLGCDRALAHKWAHGKAPIPPAIAGWLGNLSAAVEAHPPPASWRAEGSPWPIDRATTR